MKTTRYQKRFYRDRIEARGLHAAEIIVRETDMQILTDKPLDIDFATARTAIYRDAIEEYINYKDKRFLVSLKPIPVEPTAPAIVQEMAKQAEKANVGPMAAVAGAIAQFVGRDLLRTGYRDVIIENGGDIFIAATRRVSVGLFAGKKKLLNALRLTIQPQETPLGICTSSGTVGHSLSFGKADSAVIIAKNAALADAVATAVANRVTGVCDIEGAFAFARSVRGVRGAVIILKNTLATWGCVQFA